MSKVNVFITIDTEHSIGGAFQDSALKPVGNDKRVYGRVDGKEYGIPLMIDIADRYGLPLTFFVEVLNRHYFGEQESQEVCRYILGRGYDVQLHLHPTWQNFKEPEPSQRRFSDNMWAYGLDAQIELIREGKDQLARYCGHSPVAFRAGNYAADANTLRALKANGMHLDASYNRAVSHHSRRISPEDLNDAVPIEGVAEFPVTNFVERIPFWRPRFKALDLGGTSFAEIRTVLQEARDGRGPRNITLVLHSFSFLQPRDQQYRSCEVRHYVLRRFERLCRHLRDHSGDFVTRPLSEAFVQAPLQTGTARHAFFPMPFTRFLLRTLAPALTEKTT